MAYKWSMLLSLIFVIQLLLITGDIAAVQVVQTHLHATATVISHQIALTGRLSEAIVVWVEEQGLTITCLQQCNPRFGDTLTYRLSQAFDPLILSPTPITITVVRHAVIGLYD